MTEPYSEGEQRVAPLELFFDLVFAFGFTQVTTALAGNPTWSGLGHGLLILGVLWWAWAAYAWLTDTVDPEVGLVWAAMLVASAAMFCAALAVPGAFGNHGLLFGVAFLIVSCMQLALFTLGARDDAELLGAVLRVAPFALAGSVLILAAGLVDGAAKTALWCAAVAVGYVLPLLRDQRGWRVQPGHFIERHGLIVLIAIGESLIAIGLGERHSGLGAEAVTAAILGFSVASAFWLAYFDFFPIRALQLLNSRTGTARTALARDVFTYLHFPLVAGIVLFAFAMETTLANVEQHLDALAAFCLCVGPALYFFAFAAIRVRVTRELRGGRLVAAVACFLLWPVAVAVPAIVALALVAAVLAALHAYELIWWREDRAAIRAHRPPALNV